MHVLIGTHRLYQGVDSQNHKQGPRIDTLFPFMDSTPFV